jgi:hypothetical protein
MGSSYQIAFCRGGEGFSGSRPWRERWDLKVGAAVPSGDLRPPSEPGRSSFPAPIERHLDSRFRGNDA